MGGDPIDPKRFGFHASTRIERLGTDRFAIVMRRKSRIVMKDGKAILDKAVRIKTDLPTARVEVQTTAPVCGKTQKFLLEHRIPIKSL